MSDNFDPVTGEILEEEELTSLEKYKGILARKHNIALSKDEPLLALVTMHEHFLEDYEKLSNEHEKSFKKLLNGTGKMLGKQIEKTFLELKDKAITDNLIKAGVIVEQINETLETGAKHLTKTTEHLTTTRKTILWTMVATWLATVPVFVILLLLLIK